MGVALAGLVPAAEGAVAPKSAFYGGAPVRITYRAPADSKRVAIRIERAKTRRVVRKFIVRAAPGRARTQIWRGETSRGRPADDGRYRVLIGPPGGPFKPAGAFRLHDHFFPVRAPHGTRGAIGEFGAPRDGGRTHEGFDITAACGSHLAAVRAGRVLRTGFDPVLYGNYLLIHGRGEQRSYFYAHLIRPPAVHRGQQVRTGQFVGEVGQTGNAASTPCHLHFEIHYHGVPFDPEPSLRSWDRYS